MNAHIIDDPEQFIERFSGRGGQKKEFVQRSTGRRFGMTISDEEVPPEGMRLLRADEIVELLKEIDDDDFRSAAIYYLMAFTEIEALGRATPNFPHWVLRELCVNRQTDGHTPLTCSCGKSWPNPRPFCYHFPRCPVARATTKEEKKMAQLGVPTAPSNRHFIRQMIEWGCVVGKTTGDDTIMTFPNGKTITVRSARSHLGNKNSIFQEVYKTFDGARAFWAGPNVVAESPVRAAAKELPETPKRTVTPPGSEPVPTTKAPAAVTRRPHGISTAVFDLMIKHGQPLTVSEAAKRLNLTNRQVSSAMAYMASDDLKFIRRIKNGVFELIENPPHPDHRIGIDVQVGSTLKERVHATPPEVPVQRERRGEVDTEVDERGIGHVLVAPPAELPAPISNGNHSDPEVSDDEIYAMLDMLVPQGFKAVHYPSVERWVAATRDLVSALRRA